MNLPEVSVLSLGGTISSSADAGGALVVPTLTGETLVSDVPELAEVAEVSAFSFRQAASGELTVNDLIELAGAITRRIDGGADGVVVTQGTDTIEETAFVLDLLVDREAPVVVTGAMRNPTLADADGPANLLAAVRVAADKTARGLGAVIVFNDEIHAARFVRKTHTQSLATFRSDPVGPLGWLSEGKVRVLLRPSERRRVVLPERTQNHRVALLTATLDDDGRLIPMVKRLGYAGLVVEAFGGGHVPSLLVEPLETLAKTMPVVLASRAGGGEVLRSTYGFSGSETDLLGRGLIAAGPLDGLKSRLLLLLLLNSGATKEEIAEQFDRWPGR